MSTFSQAGVLSLSPRLVDGNATQADSPVVQFTLANGTGAAAATTYWRENVTLAAGDTVDVDLKALSVAKLGGTGTLNLTKVKLLMIRNTSAHTSIEVDAGAANAWTPVKPGTIGPGSLVLVSEPTAAGRATGESSKVLSFVNSDTTISRTGTATTTTISGLSTTADLYVGMLLGETHPAGTTITAIASSTSVTTSQAVIAGSGSGSGSGSDTFDFTPPDAVLDVLVVGCT